MRASQRGSAPRAVGSPAAAYRGPRRPPAAVCAHTLGVLAAIACCACALGPTAVAQTAKIAPTAVGVGAEACGVLNEHSTLGQATSTVDALVATTYRYRSWLGGWLSGLNIATSDAGLGTINLVDDKTWFLQVQHTCQDDPTALFGDVVRRFTRTLAVNRGRSSSPSAVGVGLTECSALQSLAARPDQAAGVAAFESWMHGFASGYNAFREDVGLQVLDLAGIDAGWKWLREHCAKDPSTNFNSIVAQWLFEQEAEQGAEEVPRGAAPIGQAANEPEPWPKYEPRTSVGVGAQSCKRFAEGLGAVDSVEGQLAEANASSWMQGYLSAGDTIRTGRNEKRIVWAAVTTEQLWDRTRATCRAYPDAKLADIISAVERNLELPSREPERTRSLVSGIAAERCDRLVIATSLSVAVLGAPGVDAQLATRVMQGWIEGYFSHMNANISDRLEVATALNLANVGERGAASVIDYCKTQGNSAKLAVEGITAFAASAYPAAFLQ